MTSTGLATSKAFKLSDAEKALDNIVGDHLSANPDNTYPVIRQHNLQNYGAGLRKAKDTFTNTVATDSQLARRKPSTAATGHRRVISMQQGNVRTNEDCLQEDDMAASVNARAYSEVNNLQHEFDPSPRYERRTSVGFLMQERNRKMRTDAKMHQHNQQLEDRLLEQQEELRQLRQYLRDLFELEQDKIVAASFDNTDDTGEALSASGALTEKDPLKVRAQRKSDVTKQSQAKEMRCMKAVSNIH